MANLYVFWGALLGLFFVAGPIGIKYYIGRLDGGPIIYLAVAVITALAVAACIGAVKLVRRITQQVKVDRAWSQAAKQVLAPLDPDPKIQFAYLLDTGFNFGLTKAIVDYMVSKTGRLNINGSDIDDVFSPSGKPVDAIGPFIEAVLLTGLPLLSSRVARLGPAAVYGYFAVFGIMIAIFAADTKRRESRSVLSANWRSKTLLLFRPMGRSERTQLVYLEDPNFRAGLIQTISEYAANSERWGLPL